MYFNVCLFSFVIELVAVLQLPTCTSFTQLLFTRVYCSTVLHLNYTSKLALLMFTTLYICTKYTGIATDAVVVVAVVNYTMAYLQCISKCTQCANT
jgi:hypothetical protein